MTQKELPLGTSSPAPTVTAAAIRAALRHRYASAGWALLFEVQSIPGRDRKKKKRFLDAVAIGLWPSTGFSVIGIEIKVSRADWLRELRDMSKSAAFGERCSSFYIAAAPGIVQLFELPEGWGLMTLRGDGILVTREQGYIGKAKIDMPFMAACLQRMRNPKGGMK